MAMEELLKQCTFKMPGNSYKGELLALSPLEEEISENLEQHVIKLSKEIGDRSYKKPAALKAAADYIYEKLECSGVKRQRQPFKTESKQSFENLEASIEGCGNAEEILVIGAHYDSADCPGANDNGSGVAALIELTKLLSKENLDRGVRLVAFPNEEHFYGSNGMGSYFYANKCRERNDNLIGMICLETIGYYSEESKSQKFPAGLSQFYPDRGNFLAFIGNTNSKAFLKRTISLFRKEACFPSEGLVAPSYLMGVSRSDHSQFWEHGYEAIMLTDTADHRYPYYHHPEDTHDKVDYECLARIVVALAAVIKELANS